MTNSDVLDQLQEVFKSVFTNIDSIELETTAQDVEGWDSLSHIHLVVIIEKKFGIKFKSRDIGRWKNVGDMVDSILNRL